MNTRVYGGNEKGMAEYNIHQIITSHRVTLPPMMNLEFDPGHRVKEKLAERTCSIDLLEKFSLVSTVSDCCYRTF